MNTPTITSDLSVFTDAELARATTRAFREAARCWSEYRRSPSGDLGFTLLTSAQAADEWFDMLTDERRRRASDVPTEVSSADVYVPNEAGRVYVPVIPQVTPQVQRIAASRTQRSRS